MEQLKPNIRRTKKWLVLRSSDSRDSTLRINLRENQRIGCQCTRITAEGGVFIFEYIVNSRTKYSGVFRFLYFMELTCGDEINQTTDMLTFRERKCYRMLLSLTRVKGLFATIPLNHHTLPHLFLCEMTKCGCRMTTS